MPRVIANVFYLPSCVRHSPAHHPPTTFGCTPPALSYLSLYNPRLAVLVRSRYDLLTLYYRAFPSPDGIAIPTLHTHADGSGNGTGVRYVRVVLHMRAVA